MGLGSAANYTLVSLTHTVIVGVGTNMGIHGQPSGLEKR
jgi:hypothetical protein